MSRHRLTRALSVATLLGVAACAERRPAYVTVADSAGVKITLNRDLAVPLADIRQVPNLSLGGPDEAGPTQFFRVQNVYVDPRARLWVADGQSGELRIFQPDGSPWKIRGGRGQGPGEFMSIRLLGPRSGDSVFVADDADGRVAVYDPEGELVRTQRILAGENPTPRLFGVFADGSVLGQVPRILAAAELTPGLILRDSVDLVRVDMDAQGWQPYGGALGPLWIWTGRSQVPVPFTSNAGFDIVGADDVHLVGGPAFRIRVFRGGRLVEAYGVERPPRRVGAADIEAYRRLTTGYLPQERQGEYLAALDNEARPSELPAYARLLASPDGQIWAQRYESDLSVAPVWDVFGRDRGFMGQVQTPADLIVMCITPDAIVGVWRDAVGVEYVRRYAIVGHGSL